MPQNKDKKENSIVIIHITTHAKNCTNYNFSKESYIFTKDKHTVLIIFMPN